MEQPEEDGNPLFPDLADEASQELLEGSARIALKVEPRFDRYIFIERDSNHCEQLEGLRQEFPHLAKDIKIRQGDANVVIQDLCSKDWTTRRAVLFLDPYGMQVEWRTIQQVAETGAIDLWLLFPLGIGVNRMLPRSGKFPEGWRQRLNIFLGTEDWYDAFYKTEMIPSLFGDHQTMRVKAGIEAIGDYFVERLKSIFPGVAQKPAILTNSANCPLYLFCFAVGSPNPRAQGIALNIAEDILKKF